MKQIRKSKRIISICVVTILLFSLISFQCLAVDLYESEGNNTVTTADITYNEYSNYGAISSSTDVDWWKITFSQTGAANFWMGNIPTGCIYYLYLYEADGSWLIAKSEVTTGNQQFINAYVYAGIEYTIKIISASGYSSANYLFKAKVYTTERKATIFTGLDQINEEIPFIENYSKIAPYLTTMGIRNENAYSKTARQAYEVIPTRDVVAMINHAMPGEFCFYNSTMYARSNYYDFSLFADLGRYGFEALKGVKLISFVGCQSGVSSLSCGNFVDMAREKAAWCCIGWTQSFYHQDILLWHDAFYNSLASGNTVSIAIDDANLCLRDTAVEYWTISAQYCGTSRLDSFTFS